MKFVPHGTNVCEVHFKHTSPFILCLSYSTPVALVANNKCYITCKKWSVTTTRHRNAFVSRHGYTHLTQKRQEFFDNLLENAAECLTPEVDDESE